MVIQRSLMMIISEMRLYWSSSAIVLDAVHGAKAEQMNYITTKKGIGFIDGRTDKESIMKVIVGNRGSGKTAKAIKYVKKHPDNILVVGNAHLAEHIRKEHEITVISWDNFVRRHDPSRRMFVIDDIGHCLEYTGLITMITMTGFLTVLKHKFRNGGEKRELKRDYGRKVFKEYFPINRIKRRWKNR